MHPEVYVVVNGFSQSHGVWYYHLDVKTYTGMHETILSYTIRKRFNDFAQLYNQIQAEYPGLQIENFVRLPVKFNLQSVFMSLLSRAMQEVWVQERGNKFQEFMQWIQENKILKHSTTIHKFLGSAPNSRDTSGYVSLRNYTTSSSNWMHSIKDLIKQQRRRSLSLLRPTSEIQSAKVAQRKRAKSHPNPTTEYPAKNEQTPIMNIPKSNTRWQAQVRPYLGGRDTTSCA